MLFDLNGYRYMVKFKRYGTTTIAELYTIWNNNIDYNYTNLYTEAKCNPKDRFEKSKGRKVALAKLLDKLTVNLVGVEVTKEDRTRIWEIYFKEHKK